MCCYSNGGISDEWGKLFLLLSSLQKETKTPFTSANNALMWAPAPRSPHKPGSVQAANCHTGPWGHSQWRPLPGATLASSQGGLGKGAKVCWPMVPGRTYIRPWVLAARGVARQSAPPFSASFQAGERGSINNSHTPEKSWGGGGEARVPEPASGSGGWGGVGGTGSGSLSPCPPPTWLQAAVWGHRLCSEFGVHLTRSGLRPL